jgi:predicted transcriptional regulator
MGKVTLKQKVMDSIDKLPQNASLDEIMERIYFIHKIEVGLKQSKQGDAAEHEVVLKKIDQW